MDNDTNDSPTKTLLGSLAADLVRHFNPDSGNALATPERTPVPIYRTATDQRNATQSKLPRPIGITVFCPDSTEVHSLTLALASQGYSLLTVQGLDKMLLVGPKFPRTHRMMVGATYAKGFAKGHSHAYCATLVDGDEESPIGYGATAEAAVSDLVEGLEG